MLTLEVKEFGPIAHGRVTLKPLTVLIGPNNAGKSYLALLTYSLMSPFARAGVRFRRRAKGVVVWTPYPLVSTFSPKAVKMLEALRDRGESIPYQDLDPEIQGAVHTGLQRFVDGLARSTHEEIQRCFGAGIRDLKRRATGLSIALEQDEPRVSIQLGLARGDLKLTKKEWAVEDQEIDFRELRGAPQPILSEALVGRFIRGLFPFLFTSSYYFPAARSGILQGHKAMVSFMLHRLPLVGIETIEVPRLSGVIADFIGNLLRIEKERHSSKVARLGDFLEDKICHGQIALQPGGKTEYPEILYTQGGHKIPLTRTSSMVSEMAPIILFLKYSIEEGDLVIIEEPEAHLHPDNQRIFARAVVRLIRCGVKVLVTTHSDYFLQQLSNFVRLSEKPDLRAKLGYEEGEYLEAGDVGAYLFHLDHRKGSVVEELAVTPEEGIPENEFVRIAEQIYDESAALDLQSG